MSRDGDPAAGDPSDDASAGDKRSDAPSGDKRSDARSGGDSPADSPVGKPTAEEAGKDVEPGSAPAMGALPDAVRARVVALAASALDSMQPDEIPGALRGVARFRAGRRARLAAGPLAAALSDPAFRRRVAARLRVADPELCAGLDAGDPGELSDPVDVAAHAYLLDTSGWPALVEVAERVGSERLSASVVARLTAERDRLAQEVATLRRRLDDARSVSSRRTDPDVEQVRRELRLARAGARDADRRAEEAEAAAAAARADADAAQAAHDAAQRRLADRIATLEADLAHARRDAREGRSLLDARARLLLDTVLRAARGLEQELALGPAQIRPADTVGGRAGDTAGPGSADSWGRSDDPAHLDQLLGLPLPHVVVDGYNVTKSGFGALPLADQRERLLGLLAGLATRTRAEVTVVFDGADVGPVPGNTLSRGVRVLFSDPGETADVLIGRLVRAEPPGRTVVVVSTDREVTTSARRAGAHHADSAALLRLLGR